MSNSYRLSMKRGFYPTQANGGGKGTRAVHPSMMTSNYTSDNSDNDDQNGGCLGGLISSLLGGGGAGGEPLTMSKAAATEDPNTLVAEELNKLSLKEREVVYEDLHGVALVEDESNLELVNSRLKAMKSELDKIPRSQKTAYLIAMEDSGEKGKEFCHNRSLNLKFLRADRWNPQKAAERFVAWMDWKLKLFGRDILCHRHVTLDRLDPDDRSTIQSGRIQILPERDTSGRAVILSLQTLQSQAFRSMQSMLRMFWYIMMAAVEDDVQTQRAGLVYILYSVGPDESTKVDREVFKGISRMATVLPVRLRSVHISYDDPKKRPLLTMISWAAGPYLRARFRLHEGNHTEVQYGLMTYGVPVDVFPFRGDGKYKPGHHAKWYKRRKVRDASLASQTKKGISCGEISFQGIDLPDRFDVLLGKGKPIQKHAGNRRLQDLVAMFSHEYAATPHGDKQSIAAKVVGLIQDPSSEARLSTMGGGLVSTSVHCAESPRFLIRRDDGWWEPVSEQVAIDKVCHAFRAFRLSDGKKSSAMPVVQGSSDSVMLASSTGGRHDKRVKVETPTTESETPLRPMTSMSMSSYASVIANDTDDEGLDLDMDSFDWIS